MSDEAGAVNGSGFHCAVSGKVESCQLHCGSIAICHYEFVVGDDWRLVGGQTEGESQAAKNEQTSENEPTATWNMPISLTYKSTNPMGWPRLVVTVRDASRVIRGYGTLHVPTQTGNYVRYCSLFTPRSASWLQAIGSFFAQEPPEFFDPRFVTASDGREAARTCSSGVVKVELSVRTIGMSELGFDTGSTNVDKIL